jgi:hypothetical protein
MDKVPIKVLIFREDFIVSGFGFTDDTWEKRLTLRHI